MGSTPQAPDYVPAPNSPRLPGGDEEAVDADREGVEAEPQHHHRGRVEIPRPEVKLELSYYLQLQVTLIFKSNL